MDNPDSPPPASNPVAPLCPPLPSWARSVWYGFCLLTLGGTIFWAQRVVVEHPYAEQRTMAGVSTVWGMHACLALGLIGFFSLLVPLVRLLGRRHVLTGLGLGVLAFFACGLAPKTNRIFYDEHIYMQIGQTIAHTGKAEYASHANVEYGDFQLLDSWVNKQPNGHPYVLSWVYRLAGATEDASFAATRVITGLAAAFLYFALIMAPLRLPVLAPMAVSLAFMFTPLVLWWGHTVAVEPSTAAAAIVAFFAACVHARLRDPLTGEGSPLSGLLLAATVAFAAYFRPESLLVFPMVATLLWASDRRFLEDRTTWAALALALALLTPELLHLWSVHTEDWGATDGRRFDLSFIVKNLDSNAGYFVQGKWFPLAGAVLALAGMVWLAVRNWWLGICVGLWFVLSWGIFVTFYAGGYYYGASSRYAVVSAAPVAIFVGIGAAALIALLRRRPVVLTILSVVALMNWAYTMRFVPTLGRESNEARADIDFCREVAPMLPHGSLVISTDPCIWNILGRNAAQMDSIQPMVRSELRELVRQYPGGIYLHWDYWMNTTPRFAEVWRSLIRDTHATVFFRRNAEASKFALFRLDTAYACDVFGGQYKPLGKPTDLDHVIAESQFSAGMTPPAESVPQSSARATSATSSAAITQ